MRFFIQKNINPQKKSPFKGLINLLILIIAIPVIIIAAISIFIYSIFLWVKDKIFEKEKPTLVETHYHLEFDLINNEHLRLILIEDELDDELTKLNQRWDDMVYTNDESYLYRIRSIPSIPLLDGGICCFYCKEMDDGLILQTLVTDEDHKEDELASQLIFLEYKNLAITVIGEAGPFVLENDTKNQMLIRGFSDRKKLSIELSRLNDYLP